jgi:deoxyribodipyrimidine photo-lyase
MATPSATAPALVWFRRDLRIADNPALYAAAQSGRPVVCVYVREPDRALDLSTGAAADWWLHHSLEHLAGRLEALGARLVLLDGPASERLPQLASELGAAEVYWNRTEWPWLDKRDCALATTLQEQGVTPRGFRIATLVDPASLLNGSGQPYRVFSAFWRTALKTLAPRTPLPEPERIAAGPRVESVSLADWNLLPTRPDWAKSFGERWTPGETAARARLDVFLKEELDNYRTHRDRPDLDVTSRLSPHLGWGEISPRTVWHQVQAVAERGGNYKDAEKFLAELGWRDFAYYLGHHFDDLRHTNFNRDFDHFPWRDNADGLKAWKSGRTGVPMVDAAMRELWVSGWMHNRTRMIAASYLIKHIGCHWREGMTWFEDTLVDADPLVNAASWQWVAGSGADAAPYFRVFNPASQGEKFDPDGRYVRRWVEELSTVSSAVIHAPWTASAGELARSGVTLDKTYPRPVVDLKEGREMALAAYQDMKSDAASA